MGPSWHGDTKKKLNKSKNSMSTASRKKYPPGKTTNDEINDD